MNSAIKFGNAPLAVVFYICTHQSYVKIWQRQIFSCCFHRSAVLQDKQAELTPVSTIPRIKAGQPQAVAPCLCLQFPQFAAGMFLLCQGRSPPDHDCNHASFSVSFERCLSLLHRTTGPVRSLPAATLQHLHSDHSITASYSLWHCQRTTEVAKSSRYLQIQGQQNSSPRMVSAGHLASGSPSLCSSKGVPAPNESLIFWCTKSMADAPSSSVLPSLNSPGYASRAPLDANFWTEKIALIVPYQKLLCAAEISHLPLFPFSKTRNIRAFFLESHFCRFP